MLEVGIFLYGLVATGMVAVFATVSVKELRRLGQESEAAAAEMRRSEGAPVS